MKTQHFTALLLGFLLSISFTTAEDTRFRTYGPATINGYKFPYREGGGVFQRCASSPTAGLDDINCLADFFTVGEISDRPAGSGPYGGLNDDGKVFLRWGFLRDTRPTHYDCHIGLDLSVKNWFTTTRCIDQLGSDKYEELLRGEGIFTALKYLPRIGRFGVQKGQEYKRDVLQQIFDAEKNDIIKVVRNAHIANDTRAIVFEVGNEPNVFPAMSSGLYAWYLKTYVDAIRAAALTANQSRTPGTPEIQVKVMTGGLWIFDGMPPYLLKVLDSGVRITFGTLSVSVPSSIKFCGKWWFKYPCGLNHKSIQVTSGMDIKSRFSTNALQYWREVIAIIGKDVIDIANLHFYPYIDKDAQLDMQGHLTNLKSMAKEMALSVKSHEVWLTEFGNVNPFTDQESSVYVMLPVLRAFKDPNFNAGVNIPRWYWFESDGNDKKFKLLPSLTSSPLQGGVLSAVLGLAQFAVDKLTLGIIQIKEPTMTTAEATQLIQFVGKMAAKNPAQGLFDNGVLTKQGALYHKCAKAPTLNECTA